MSGVFHVGDDAYDAFMGRYSVRLAPMFAEFAGVHDALRVLDVGAGTGAFTRTALERGADVTAAEPSQEFCAALRERFPEVDVRETPAEALPFADESFDLAAAQLVVAFMADAPRAVAEMGRVARSVAVCMWGTKEVEMFAAIDRTAKAIDAQRSQEGATRYRTQEELVALLQPLGDVEATAFDVTAPYDDFDDFWRALSAQVGPAGAWLTSLDDDQRSHAREILHRELGSPAGAFTLSGRCYAARVSTEARSAPVPTSVT